MAKSPNSKEPLTDGSPAAPPTGPAGANGRPHSTRKHSFAGAAFSVVRLEEIDDLANLKADLVSVYRPVNSQELFALERIAVAQQALLRIARLEAGLLTTALDRALDRFSDNPTRLMSDDLVEDIDVLRAQNRNFALADGFRQMAGQSDVWKLFLRYQAQTERNYRRAIEDFERLKKMRPELPNEPIVEADPAPPQPLEPRREPKPERSSDPLDYTPGTRPDPAPVKGPIVIIGGKVVEPPTRPRPNAPDGTLGPEPSPKRE
jgi:hypothetical protein